MTEPPFEAFLRINRASLIRVAMFAGVTLLVSLATGGDQALPIMSFLFWIGAMVSAATATMRRESLHGAPRLTRWDESLFLLLLGLLTGFVARA